MAATASLRLRVTLRHPTSRHPCYAPTRNEAARFLTQATFGPAPADVDRVVALGYAAWLDEQFSSQASTHLPAVPAFGDTLSPQFFGQFPILSTFWTKAAIAPDQLRQRSMYSLSQLFVISMNDANVLSYPQGIATWTCSGAMHSAIFGSCSKT